MNKIMKVKLLRAVIEIKYVQVQVMNRIGILRSTD